MTTSGKHLILRGSMVALSMLLFAVSLALDGFYVDRGSDSAWSPCLGLLLIGWMGMFDGIFAWLANPFLLVAWVLMLIPRARFVAPIFAIVAILLALSFLLHEQIMVDEAGNYAKITGYGTGYWLWVASMAAALSGCVIGVLLPPTAHRTN